jgi:hypothetical protein
MMRFKDCFDPRISLFIVIFWFGGFFGSGDDENSPVLNWYHKKMEQRKESFIT